MPLVLTTWRPILRRAAPFLFLTLLVLVVAACAAPGTVGSPGASGAPSVSATPIPPLEPAQPGSDPVSFICLDLHADLPGDVHRPVRGLPVPREPGRPGGHRLGDRRPDPPRPRHRHPALPQAAGLDQADPDAPARAARDPEALQGRHDQGPHGPAGADEGARGQPPRRLLPAPAPDAAAADHVFGHQHGPHQPGPDRDADRRRRRGRRPAVHQLRDGGWCRSPEHVRAVHRHDHPDLRSDRDRREQAVHDLQRDDRRVHPRPVHPGRRSPQPCSSSSHG